MGAALRIWLALALLAPLFAPQVSLAQVIPSGPNLAVAADLRAAAGEDTFLALAPLFTDHMVLQRDHEIRVRGKARPGASVSVELQGQRAVGVRADALGNWLAVLPAAKATSGLALTVRSGAASISLADVSVGDVFLCSGQSNMEFPLRLASDADNAIAQVHRGGLRLFSVPRQSSPEPLANLAMKTMWQPASPQPAREFSAACYFMGVELQKTRKVPIGLIASSWGGSFIEAWLGQEVLKASERFSDELGLLALWRTDRLAAERQWQAGMDAYFKGGFKAGPSEQIADPSANWEEWGRGLGSFDGFGTYSTTIELDRNEARDARVLSLGTIDDIDETIVNGKPVGKTSGWDTRRLYDLPRGLLKPGQNAIEIRVLDTGGGGGLYGPGQRSIVLENGRQLALDSTWHFRPGLELAAAGQVPRKPWDPTSGPGMLANGMIDPLGDFPLAGIAWYQGESNTSDPSGYYRLLPQLIADWRARFDTRRFAIVQLANFGAPNAEPEESDWAGLREAQRRIAANDPDAALVVTIDIGDPHDIHPANKRTVGQRLALAMDGADKAALPQVARKVGDTKIALSFDADIVRVGAEAVIGFEACGMGKCSFVDARLQDRRTIVLPVRPADETIRFLWSDSPVTNLFYRDGTPVTPFESPLPPVPPD